MVVARGWGEGSLGNDLLVAPGVFFRGADGEEHGLILTVRMSHNFVVKLKTFELHFTWVNCMVREFHLN